MEIFDGILEKVKSIFDKNPPWIRRKASSALNIENCGGTAREDEETKACEMCVSVNGCCFVNEGDKKPQCPQHPNCRCKELPESVPAKEFVTLDFPVEKISNYLFEKPSKAGLPKAMGYTINDAQEMYNEISKQAREKYADGNYVFHHHNKNGYAVSIPVKLKGKGIKLGRDYNFYTGWVIYPDFKLINSTPFGGWIKRS